MDAWLAGATIVLTWGIRIMAAIVGLLALSVLYRVITYKPPVVTHDGRADIYSDALATLRLGKKYTLASVAVFDNNPQKLILFAEALGGALHTQVAFDESGGQIVFFTAAEEEEEE